MEPPREDKPRDNTFVQLFSNIAWQEVTAIVADLLLFTVIGIVAALVIISVAISIGLSGPYVIAIAIIVLLALCGLLVWFIRSSVRA